MVRTTRRRLLAVGGAAALTGCTSDLLSSSAETTTEDDPPGSTATSTPDGTTVTSTPTTTTSGESIDDAVAEVLASVPASVDGTSVQSLRIFGKGDAEDAPASQARYMSASQYAEQIGLNPDQVDRVAIALYAESTGLLSVAGSFGADEPSISENMPQNVTTYRADGRFVLAADGGENPWEAGMDAVKATLDGDRKSILSVGRVRTLLAPIGGSASARVFPSFPPSADGPTGASVSGEAVPDALEGAAVGSEIVADRTVKLTFVGVFDDAFAVDPEAMSVLTDRSYDVDPSDLSFERDGRRLVGTGHTEFEPRPSPGASPDAHFRVQYDDEAGEVILTHRGDEVVEPANLTVTVGDESVTGVWSGGTVEPGDVARVSADPFVPVRVEWTDPEGEDVFDYLAREIATPRDVFEPSYDQDADAVTITYTGSRPAPTDHLRLEVDRCHPEPQPSGSDPPEPPEECESEAERPLSEWTGTLQPDESVVVEDVQYRESVGLSAHYEWDRGGTSSSVMHYIVSAPGEFQIHQDEGVEVVYTGEGPNPADSYRVTVGGDPADTQFADEYTTLSPEDAIDVAAEPGLSVVVEWVGEGDPVVMERERIEPPVEFELLRQGDIYELTYTAETDWPADSLTVRIDDEQAATQFADSYTSLSNGASISLEIPLGEDLEVVWSGPGESMTVYRAYPPSSADFELEYADGSATLTYAGKGAWPVDDLEIRVGESTVDATFGGSEVTDGDSVTVPASPGDEIEVRYVEDGRTMHLFHETAHPPLSFGFDYDQDADTVTITLESDVSVDSGDLRVLVFGADDREHLDAWSDEYATVERGDAVTVSVPSTLEGVVVVHEPWEFHTDFRPGESEGSDG